MNKFISRVAVLVLLFTANTLSAQSLSDIISSVSATDVVSSVTGGTTISVSSVEGEWNYVGAAVELSSDCVATSAAGTLASSQLEEKLDALFSSVGIQEDIFAFVFNSDMTFTSNIKSRNLSGTYTVDPDNNQITLKYSTLGSINLGSLTASVTLVGTSMSLLFNADKLLSFVSALASVSSNSTLALVSSLVDQYDGVKIGFELEGEAQTTEEAASSAVSTATGLINKLF